MLPFKIACGVVGVALAVTCSRGFSAQPGLDAERIVLAAQGVGAGAEIRQWQERARATGAKAMDFERLGWAYVARARTTLDEGFYKLAELTADVLEKRFDARGEAWLLRGHALHNQHRFAEAEVFARRLVSERGLAWDFALLSDVLMEQGRVVEAVEACQQLVNLRPGMEAYSRIAHLRWLKGDLDGAIAAMEESVRASGGRDPERACWSLVRLSGYQLQAGRAPLALTLAETALERMPAYAPAELAHGKALLASGNTAKAIASLQSAEKNNPLPEYQWWLADALRIDGRDAEAAIVDARLVARGESADPRTYSLFLSTRGQNLERASHLARTELAARGDVFTHDALAWSLLAAGRTAEAEVAMSAALAEGTRDARLLWHAGELAVRSGRDGAAKDLFARAQAMAWTLTPSERARLFQQHATTAQPPTLAVAR